MTQSNMLHCKCIHFHHFIQLESWILPSTHTYMYITTSEDTIDAYVKFNVNLFNTKFTDISLPCVESTLSCATDFISIACLLAWWNQIQTFFYLVKKIGISYWNLGHLNPESFNRYRIKVKEKRTYQGVPNLFFSYFHKKRV